MPLYAPGVCCLRVTSLWAMNGWAYSAEVVVLSVFILTSVILRLTYSSFSPEDLLCMRQLFSPILMVDKACFSGAYINHAMSWRWVYGIWGLVGAILLVPFIILVPETRGGVILAARAERVRKSGRPHAWAIHEKLGRRSPSQIMKETVLRPACMSDLYFMPYIP